MLESVEVIGATNLVEGVCGSATIFVKCDISHIGYICMFGTNDGEFEIYSRRSIYVETPQIRNDKSRMTKMGMFRLKTV